MRLIGPFEIGPKEATYGIVGEAEVKLKSIGLPTQFHALSIGARGGRGPQVCIIPLDESSREAADKICELLNRWWNEEGSKI